MKATINIKDNPDGRTCEIELRFDPPLKALQPGEKPSPARHAVEVAFAAIKANATIGREEYHSRS